ncbi:DUF86 domain-containing protein [Candidatus Woesearchaeota archaeon]|nr:DUF86 domain-containing protein [Candidatus Woesearchaeota archaeon]
MKKTKLFTDIQKYLDDLEELLPATEDDFLNDKKAQYGIPMLLLNIINACIDLANEVITIQQLGYPTSYRESFQLLERRKIISKELSQKMQSFVGLRNLLAHEYGDINFEILYEQAQDLQVIEQFKKKMVVHF